MSASRFRIIMFALVLSLPSIAAGRPAQDPIPKVGSGPVPGHATPQQKTEAKRLAAALLYGSLILFVFVIFTWALLRFTRHYRTYLARGKRTPTASDDVWAMHRPPPEELWPGDDPDEELQK